ncbi:MAG: hypothetical protein QGG40_00290 [Myxococcota bacterium]|jgi:hypothetical protein|nr:hypothetical protein [Myxococcota bacterium]
MGTDYQLRRLNAFEGLCLTSLDLQDEQSYHRKNLQRHNLYLHGHGIVQGLQVLIEQKKKKYEAVIQEGFGITRSGQGVLLPQAVRLKLEVPKKDGEYMLWLFHVEQLDEDHLRSVFDTHDKVEARVVEMSAARLHAIDEDYADAVALCRINVRLGRMVQVMLPVPRAGRQSRAAESYLKPRVVEFIRINKQVTRNLFRTALLKELDLGALGFFSALVSSEFLLIEEGTSDRVLFRTAGSLIAYAHDFYNPLPKTIARVDKFKEFVRRVNAEVPAADQGDEVWLRWFDKFERLLQPLGKIADELEKTVEAQR